MSSAAGGSSYGPQPSLPDKVLETYLNCIASKQVLYYPSQVKKEENELKTEIRLCESLAKKPGPTPSQLRSALKRVEDQASGSNDNGATADGTSSAHANQAGEEGSTAQAEELRKKLEEEEKKQAEKQKAGDGKPKDVFEPKNWDSLLVGEFDGGVGEEYGVLLNKYAVVPLHFLLVTKHWEHQTAPLTPPQLLAAYQILSIFSSTPPHHLPSSTSTPILSEHDSPTNPQVGGELLCFFNCGTESGASQKHKHLQFAPMLGEGSIGHFPSERAAEACHFTDPRQEEKAFTIDALPYAHHIRRLSPPNVPSPQSLHGKDADAVEEALYPLMTYLQEAYLSLLDAMIDNLRMLHDADPSSVDGRNIRLGKGGLSYNLLLTRKHMHIIPRRESIFSIDDEHSHNTQDAQEGEDKDLKVPDTPQGKAVTEPCIIGCNALAYTGTVLVKSAGDSKRLVERGGVLAALEHCGYAKASQSLPSVDDDAL